MAILQVAEVREALPELLRRAEEGEHFVIEREGREVAALVSIEDLRFLEQLEDRIDLEEARKALEEPGSIPWEEVKARLGL
ncbi:MAG: type II toxin-antitoxin system Phd/YefM family antitoxin [Deltaproteobacteria bacterium]|nr:type II toxin-antitoxin system Phd/YefM family antitoxin [Deltaproteobacteria bacterium]